jgi:hypothetical protein
VHWRNLIGISAAAALLLLPGGAVAQQKSIKDQLVGVWTVLWLDGVKADGTHVPLFGPNPIGREIVAANGRYLFQIMRTINRPPFASNNRDTGTAEENKAAVQGVVSHFGTYTVDEGERSWIVHIEGSSFPNLEGGQQKVQIIDISDDLLTWKFPAATSTNPAGGFVTIESGWKKVK